jgi:endogenous inhibitor of DNA gyrase (YacG/DUF329 family)
MAKWPRCAVCGKAFRREPSAPHKLYCSPRHARTAEARRWRERRVAAQTAKATRRRKVTA